MGTPRPVNPAIWSDLGRSLGELPYILNNGVEHTLIMALSRIVVRLHNEVATVVSRSMGERDAERLYHLSRAETLRLLLTEEYETAVADASTVVAEGSLRHLAGSSVRPREENMAAAPISPPSSPLPHYGAGSSSFAQPLFGAASRPAVSPPSFSGPQYYAPEEDPRQGYDLGYGARSREWSRDHSRVTRCLIRPPSPFFAARYHWS